MFGDVSYLMRMNAIVAQQERLLLAYVSVHTGCQLQYSVKIHHVAQGENILQ